MLGEPWANMMQYLGAFVSFLSTPTIRRDIQEDYNIEEFL